jgi:ATP-dependent RNA helicase DeaD
MKKPAHEKPANTNDKSTESAGFSGLGLDESLLSQLAALGYEEPTPIQREAIPPLVEGKDVLGQAATGTGKTAAFALPILSRIGKCGVRRSGPAALVLVPTRELAMQVSEAVHRYGKTKGATVLPIYGGQSIGQQLRALDRGVDIVVATPGRALDHIERGTLDLSHVKILVLDEADEMLDMGFAEDLDAILETVPAERQTALFSATMPPRIAEIARKHLNEPVKIHIAKEKLKEGEVPKVRQMAFIVPRPHKVNALTRVLDMEDATSTIVFCRTRVEVDQVSEAMTAHGYRAEAIHGGISQDQRDRVMKRFRGGKSDLLIATDVAARGLDISHVSHVINFDMPNEPEAYVHRIGRTGRMGREGVAILFIEPREHRQLRNIEFVTKQRIEIAKIPTAGDIHARRLARTGDSLREAVAAGDLDHFRVVVESLANEFDPLDIAAAAVKMLHSSSSKEDEAEEIPEAEERPRSGFGDRRGFRDARGGFGDARGERGRRFEKKRPPFGARNDADRARLFIGVGKNGGIRPGDLVGAIANEANVPSSLIGSIEIKEQFSLVDVPAELAQDVIRALRMTTIRGKRAMVRMDRDSGTIES